MSHATALQIMATDCEYALEQAPIGCLRLDAEGRILWCNQTLARWLPLDRRTMLGRPLAVIAPELLHIVLEGEGPLPDGGAAPRRLRAQRHPEQPELVYLQDITQLHELQHRVGELAQQMEGLSLTDPCTGLPNQRALLLALDPQVARCRRYADDLAAVVLAVQPETGPADPALTLHVSRYLRDQLRWSDLLARLDTGEFVAALPAATQDAAHKLVHKMRTGLTQALRDELAVAHAVRAADDTEIHARFGVAQWQRGDDAQSLLRRAHEAAGRAPLEALALS